MSLLNDDRIARDNLSTEDRLTQQMNSIESQLLEWMSTAITLHDKVDSADQAKVLALRDELISKITLAVAI